MAVTIDLFHLLGLIAIIGILIIYLVWRIRNDYLFVPERKVLMTARLQGLPVLARNELGGSNRTRLYLGEKEKKDNFVFKIPGVERIHIDVSKITSDCAPQDLGGGLHIFQYSTMHAEPISAVNACAIKSVRRTISEKFPFINALPDDQQMDILNSPDSDLKDDCKHLVTSFTPETEWGKKIETDDLALQVEEAKRDLAKKDIHFGLFSFSYAFRNIATASTGYHMQLYGDVREQIARQEGEKSQLSQWMPVFVILSILIGGAIAYTIIS